ncbi:MAG: hypothetical protein AAB425_11250, partial [Bdellovibrionota bacterium]
MNRHGYPNCVSCHMSPSGGGALTEYGRGLSHELLSTWGSEAEANSVYGLVPFPKWLSIAGDTRILQLIQDTPATTSAPGALEGRVIRMQIDVEPAVVFGPVSAAASVGLSQTTTSSSIGDELVSRRHWAMYQINEAFTVRAGRFYPAYGILFPNHVTATRARLGWDQGMESYNLETAWTHEEASCFLTLIAGRPDKPSLKREVGAAFRPSYNLNDQSVVGLSFAHLRKTGDPSPASRNAFGPWWTVGLPAHLYLLGEFDLNLGSLASGLVTSHKLGWEFYKGVHASLLADYGKRDFSTQTTWYASYGVGVD